MWIYTNKEFTDEMINNNYGFVYVITNLTNNKKYIGKKFFYSLKTKIVKGKRKKIKVFSDWKTYFGSNKELIADVLSLGERNFKREIIHLCESKSMCAYLEAMEQFSNNVLESDDYYNSWIMVRVHKKHIKNNKTI